jgi:serine/threonine protein kinase
MHWAEDISKSTSDVTNAVGSLLDTSPLRFLCGIFRRYHSTDKSCTTPVSMISLCATKKPAMSPTGDEPPHLVVVKEVSAAPMDDARTGLRHVHPLFRLQHLRNLIEAQRALIARLEEHGLMSFTVLEAGGRLGAGVSTNGLSVDAPMSESANGFARTAVNVRGCAVVATAHAALYEPTATLFLFQEYVPAQSLEQLLQLLPMAPPPRAAAAGESDGGGVSGAAANSGESDAAANSSGRKPPITFCRKLPVAHVVTAIIKEFLTRLRNLHRGDIPHAHIRPSSVLLSVDATDRETFRYNVWLDNVNVLCTRSPLQDDDLWRWYAPEVSLEDLVDVEARTQWPEHLVEKWKRADIFAAGLLVSFLLTGSRPFDACSLAQMLACRTKESEFMTLGLPNSDHYTKRLNSRSKTRNPHGAKLEEIVQRCTSWCPLNRPSVEVLLQEIELLYRHNPDAEQHDDDADDGDNISNHEIFRAHAPSPALPPPAPSPPLIQPAQFNFFRQSMPASHPGSPQNPLVGRATTGSSTSIVMTYGNSLPIVAADVSGGEQEEPVVSTASHPSVRLLEAHSASVDRRHHSSSSNTNRMGHMFIQSGSTNLNVPNSGRLPLATPADHGGLSVVAAASELPQAGASNLFIFSQYNIATLAAADYHIKSEQIDAEELRAIVLLRCFGADEAAAPGGGGPSNDGSDRRLSQLKNAKSHWRYLAYQFADLVLKYEHCYPYQQELRAVFEECSQAEAFWSLKKRHRKDARMIADRSFLSSHVTRVRPNDGASHSFGGSTLNASAPSSPNAMLALQMQVHRQHARMNMRHEPDSSPHLVRPSVLSEIGAYIRAAVWRVRAVAASRGDISGSYAPHANADDVLHRQEVKYYQFIQATQSVTLLRIRMTFMLAAIWTIVVLVSAVCRSLGVS